MWKALVNLHYRFRCLTGLTRVSIDGVTLDISPSLLDRVLARAVLRGTYEGPERKLAKAVLRRGMSVIEVGAGIGLVGLVAARLVEDGQVVSYEANPNLERIIRRNYSLNARHPRLDMRAVTKEGFAVRFFRNPNVVSSSLLDRETPEAQQISVDSVRLQDVIAENKPDVLIMDVEGAEVSLLGECDLGGIQHIIAELHPHIVGEDVITKLIATIEDKGFVVAEQIKKTVHFQRKA